MALDVMMHNLPAIEDAGYSIVLSVHDELVAEVPMMAANDNHELMAELMARPVPWALGLPLAADGFTAQVYRK